jgi:hypothetical protein
MGHFRPGERITQIHGTAVPAPVATGARNALAYALYHPAAALRSTEVERQSYIDIAGLPRILRDARARRAGLANPAEAPAPAPDDDATMVDPGDDPPTLFQPEA